MYKLSRIFFLFFVSMNLCAYAGDDSIEKTGRKIRVHLDNFTFEDGGIWFLKPSSNVRCGIAALRSDTVGYYYLDSIDEYWECPNGHRNPGVYYGQKCTSCGWPIWKN